MLTLARKSEICAINLAFAAEFARELSTQADGRWFDVAPFHAPDTERRHEAIAPYLARQKEQKLAHEAAGPEAADRTAARKA
jgi:hypothetical protein